MQIWRVQALTLYMQWCRGFWNEREIRQSVCRENSRKKDAMNSKCTIQAVMYSCLQRETAKQAERQQLPKALYSICDPPTTAIYIKWQGCSWYYGFLLMKIVTATASSSFIFICLDHYWHRFVSPFFSKNQKRGARIHYAPSKEFLIKDVQGSTSVDGTFMCR